jgi:outer membrane receptor protein involved in Fe transport
VHTNFVISAFGGVQYEEIGTDLQVESTTLMQESHTENKTTSYLAGVGLQFKGFVFSDFNYRSDKFSMFADDNNIHPTYSFNTSFIFTDAFGWTTSWFSQGKLRASVGKMSVANRQGYPQDWQLTSSLPNPGLVPESSKMLEYGTDFLFVKDRVLLSATYFLNDTENLLVRTPLPPGAGYGYVFVNTGELHTDGVEIVLGGTPVRKSNLSLDLKVIWATLNTRVESLGNGNPDGGNGGGIGGETVLGNPNTDWRGSFLSQLIWKNAFFSFLMNIRKGGDIFIPHYNNGAFEFSIVDGSQARLQDVSIGYKLNTSLLRKAKMRQAQISLSGRNLWTIYAESDVETDNGSSLYTPQKSVNLSLSLMF